MSTSAERLEKIRQTIFTGAVDLNLKGVVYKLSPLPLAGIKYLDEFGTGSIDALVDLVFLSASQVDPSVEREEFALGIDFSNVAEVRQTLFEVSGIAKQADPKVEATTNQETATTP